MFKIHTHYDNLKIAHNAPDNIVRAAYQALAENYQPSKFKGTKQEEAHKILEIIRQSYETLIDPLKRAEHDHWIAEQQEKIKRNKVEPVIEIVENDKIDTPVSARQHQVFNRLNLSLAAGLSIGFVLMYGYLNYPTLLRFENEGGRLLQKISQTVSIPNSNDEIYYRANDLIKNNHPDEALPLYQYLADNGNVIAQNVLAGMYEKGHGIPQNHELAAQWYQKAITQIQSSIHYNLDLVYAKNTPEKAEEVAQWYQKAAEQGDVLAQLKLGVLYEKGQGVSQNYALAAQWYQKAAEKENTAAQFYLGVLYEKGQGVPQNYTLAVQWYQKAAIQGNAEAQFNLGVMYEKGQGVPQDFGNSAQWYQDASTNQNENLKYTDPTYIHAQNSPQNDEAAIQWYQKAANQGYSMAQYNLGVMYQKGHGVSKNLMVAYSLFNLSATVDGSSSNPAIALRYQLINEMSASQIELGQNLTQKMMAEKSNLTKTIAQFIALK